MRVYLLISISYDTVKDKFNTKSISGIYTSADLAIESIKEYADDLAEGGYFNYILIEERDTDCYNAHSTWEFWYQVHTSVGRNHFVESIKKPDIFQSYSNFV